MPAGRTFRLDNGLAVTLVPYGTIPKVTVRLGVRAGNIDEKANEVWLADLTGSMLTEGTATRTATQIAEDAARMGGSLDVTVGGGPDGRRRRRALRVRSRHGRRSSPTWSATRSSRTPSSRA